jgi:hypothetical protein
MTLGDEMKYTKEQIEAEAQWCENWVKGADAAAMLRQLLAENDAMQSEIKEQCRIIGMSLEREMLLRSKVKVLRNGSEQYRLRHETMRALYPSAPSDVELDVAINAARKEEP